jgi:hypothetical protein
MSYRPLLLCVASATLLGGGGLAVATSGTDPEFSPVAARAVFEEARRDCEADGGHLWGRSLCGPVLLVAPATRKAFANQADPEGHLQPQGRVFVAQVPAALPLANTAVDWAGVHWSEMLWPLPTDAAHRRTLMAHESFHRIQADIGLPAADPVSAHLDSLDGRYALQLEWRALAAALAAGTDDETRERVADALAFRAERYRRFPGARASEAALERSEGLAEYTGVMVGNPRPADRLAIARENLVAHVGDASFVRSFAYATGPAYGLLLDRLQPDWRERIAASDSSPAEMLATALNIDMHRVASRAHRYDGAALLASERARAEARERRATAYTAQLVDGPILRLPLTHMKVQFNPTTLMPLGEAGTVYPTMHVSDDWGVIDVDGGALMATDWSRLTVAAPDARSADGGKLHGNGWTLELAPGWQLAPGDRPGDRTVTRTPDSARKSD